MGGSCSGEGRNTTLIPQSQEDLSSAHWFYYPYIGPSLSTPVLIVREQASEKSMQRWGC
jgi:hypothetical protein